MAKSSYAVVAILAGWGAHAAAQAPADPVTADAAMQRYHDWLSGAVQGCPASGPLSDEEIVVCGRRGHRQPERSPLPVQREPGEIVRHAGEAGGGDAAMFASGCILRCAQPVTIDLIGAARAVPKVINHILGKDD